MAGPRSPTWSGGRFPAFSYLFSKTPLTTHDGGTTKQVGTYDFPVSKGMAGVYMTLEPGAIRQLHWHPNADEWQYMLKGEMVLGVFASEGKASISRLAAGDVGYVPKGYGQVLRNDSDQPLDVLVVFNSGDYRCAPWRAKRGRVVPGRRRRGRVAVGAQGR